MDAGGRAVALLDMFNRAQAALKSGGSVDRVICRALAEALAADSALSFLITDGRPGRTVMAYPNQASCQRLQDFVVQASPRPGRVPGVAEAPGLGEVLVLGVGGARADRASGNGPSRGFAFAASRGFADDQRRLLGEAAAPLAVLLPHIAASALRRERLSAGQRAAKLHGLTPRELEVLNLLAQGLLATSIAARLDLSPRTVHKHLGNLYTKLGVHDRLVATNLAVQQGLVEA